MFAIIRTPQGTRAKAIPGKDLPKEVFETFNYAVGAYSFVLDYNKPYTCEEWIGKIEAYFDLSERRNRVIEAIRTAMNQTKK